MNRLREDRIGEKCFYKQDLEIAIIKHRSTFDIESLAYVREGIGNFKCRCRNCGLHDILTVPEMNEHKCEV